MHFLKSLILATAIILTISPNLCSQSTKEHFKTELGLNYLCYLPAAYNDSIEQQWPLVLFLHGSGERGNDLEKVKMWGPPKLAESNDLPFILIAPQCPEGNWWDIHLFSLHELVKHISQTHRVDTNRIYLTGLSMGGFGTWALASAYPKTFAAIAPVCGGGNTRLAKNLVNIPIWAFHGDADKVVSPKESIQMVDSLKSYGANIKFTLYKDVDHFSWIPAYNESGLLEWLLKQKKH